MLIPTKHEKIQRNTIVLGASVISYLKKHGSENIEDLFQLMKQNVGLSLDQYGNVITVLWLGGIVSVNEYRIYLK